MYLIKEDPCLLFLKILHTNHVFSILRVYLRQWITLLKMWLDYLVHILTRIEKNNNSTFVYIFKLLNLSQQHIFF